MTRQPSPRTGGRAARPLLAGVRFYQRAISPALPPRCRFHPTCSAYAVEAIERHGAARGSWLALCRLLKCAPWHPGGVDPVPDPRRRSGDGTARAGRSSSTATPDPASPADGARRPDRDTPSASRRALQEESSVV